MKQQSSATNASKPNYMSSLQLKQDSLSMTIPSCLNAEQAVIGGILTNPNKYYEVSRVIDNPDAFFFIKTQMLWVAMTALADNQKPIDPLMMSEQLKGNPGFEQVGGIGYLLQLISGTPTSAYVEVYANLVQRAYIRRQMIVCADKIKAVAANESATTEEIGQYLDEQERIYASLDEKRAQHIGHHASAHMDAVETAMKREKTTRIESGWVDLDKMIGGFMKRKLIVIGGMPHHGKTATLMGIGLHAAKSGYKVAFMNVADGDEQDVMNRFIMMESGLATEKLEHGELTTDEYDLYVKTLGNLTALPIGMKSEKGMSPGKIRAECKTMLDMKGRPFVPEVIIIDYIQRMDITGERDEYIRLNRISKAITILANEENFNCPIIVGAQLKRDAARNNRPTEHDIKGTGNIAEDADIVIIPFRESMVNGECNDPNSLELIVAKNKQTGRKGTINCYFEEETATIKNAAIRNVDLGNRPSHYADK